MEQKAGLFIKDKDTVMGAYAPYYDFLMKIITLGREKKLRQTELDIINIREGSTVLEIGCGTGTLSISSKIRTGASGKVYGIDAAPEMIQRAKKKAGRSKTDVDFRIGDISSLPFDDSLFDVVMCSFMIFHVSSVKREKGFKEINRVLKNNGVLVIVDTIKEEGLEILKNSMNPLFTKIEYGFKQTGRLSPDLAFIRGTVKKTAKL